ncbi:hypothetical protein MAR_020008 [Mya arenaria]|uniref:Uncharacterized protein n=1 Tax=Mya arenaria TaxID=6604 RepID=A0ABY7E8B5_MYAAR|nr:hypothetical protein MAR_020008 [Mya arenaria]
MKLALVEAKIALVRLLPNIRLERSDRLKVPPGVENSGGWALCRDTIEIIPTKDPRLPRDQPWGPGQLSAKKAEASFHHHSSVHLIKRNMRQLFKWLDEKPENEKATLMKAARSGGRDLRKAHMADESLVKRELFNTMQVEPKNTKTKSSKISENQKLSQFSALQSSLYV